MKQKLLLPMLLALLTCLGVQASDVDVTIGNWSDTSVWKTPFANAYSSGEAVMVQGNYTLTYTSAGLSAGALRIAGTGTTAANNVAGTLTLPSFNRPVEKIVITATQGGSTSRISVTDKSTGKTFVANEGKSLSYVDLTGSGSIVRTIEIPASDQTTAAQFEFKVLKSSYVVINKIEVTLGTAVGPGLKFSESEVTVMKGNTFTAPTLTTLPEAEGITITYSSSDTNIVSVDPTTGEAKLGGSTGTATISATSKAGYVGDGDTYFSAETVSYKVIVYDPYSAVSLPFSKLDALASGTALTTSLNDKNFTDDSQFVKFGFSKGGSTSNVSYNFENKRIVFSNGNTLNIDLLKSGWVIDKIIIDCNGSAVLYPCDVKVNGTVVTDEVEVKQSGSSFTWTFTGVNAEATSLVYKGTGSANVVGVTVYARRPNFTIKVLQPEVTGKVNQTLSAMSSYFEITDLNYGGSSEDYSLDYSVDPASAASIVTVNGVKTLRTGSTNGATAKVYATYTPNSDSPYGPTQAYFDLTVTGKEILTMTLPESSITLGILAEGTPANTYNIFEAINVTNESNENEKPEKATGLTYISSDTSIAEVKPETGVVTAVAPGTAVITVTYPGTDNIQEAKATLNVTVEDNRVQPVISFSSAKEVVLYTAAQTWNEIPELNGATGYQVTYSKEGANIFESFNTENGTYKLNGNIGVATVTATIAAVEGKNKNASASYTIVVYNPSELQLNPAEQYAEGNISAVGSINNTTLTDASGFVSFNFTKTGTLSGAQYTKDGNITLNENNILTVRSLKTNYYIAEVVFAYANGSLNTVTLNPTTSKFENGKWTFEGVDVQQASLTNNASAASVSNITVKLRRATLKIAPDAKSLSYKKNAGDIYSNIEQNIVATNLEGEVIEKLTYDLTTAEDAIYPIEDGKLNIEPIEGHTYPVTETVYVAFAGNDLYEAATTTVEINIVEDEPLTITLAQDLKTTLQLYPEAESLNILDAVDSVKNGETSLDKNNLNIAIDPDDSDVVTYDESTKTIVAKNPGTVAVVLTYDGVEGQYATTVSKFDVTVEDSRTKQTLSFSPATYVYNLATGGTFASPMPTQLAAAGLTASDLKWTVSGDAADVVKVSEDGTVSFEGTLDGVKTATVTASLEDNTKYLDTEASYTITVVGTAETLGENPELSGLVNIRGYITGSSANGYINVAGTEGDTSVDNNVAVRLTGAAIQALNLTTKPELVGRQIIVYGNATAAKAVTMTSYTLLVAPQFSLTDTVIPSSHPVVGLVAPEGLDLKKVSVSIKEETGNSGVNVALNGSILTFSGENLVNSEDNPYTLVVNSEDDTLPFIPGTYEITGIRIEEMTGHTQTFTFAAEPGVTTTPYIYIESDNGRVYTVNEETMQPEAQPMTKLDGQYLGFDRQLWVYTAEIFDADMYEGYEYTEPNEPAEGDHKPLPNEPNYDGANGGYQDKVVLSYLSGSNSTKYPDTHLNIYFSDEQMVTDGVFNATRADVFFTNAPVNKNIVYTGSKYTKSQVTLFYFDNASGKYEELAVLTNDNNSFTPNLWEGTIDFSKPDQDMINMVIATAITDGVPSGTIFGSSKAMTDEEAAAWATSILTVDNKKSVKARAEEVADKQYTSNISMAEIPAANFISTEANSNGLLLDLSTGLSDYTAAPVKVELSKGGQPMYDENGQLTDQVTDPVYAIGIARDSEHEGDIETIVWETNADDADVMWFTLQGERIAEPSEGIVIRVQGTKAQKVLIRK